MIITALFKNRSFTAIVLAQLATRWVMLVPIYYLPIHFEAVLDHTATKAGIDLLGVILSLVIASTAAGFLVKTYGRYTPFLIGGPLLACLGCGLLYTINPNTPIARIIGFEIIVGTGVGMFMQLGMLASQAEFATQPHLMGKISGIVTFSQTFGGIVGLAVGGAVFGAQLHSNLDKCEMLEFFIQYNLGELENADVRICNHLDAPGVNSVVASSPTVIRSYVSGQNLENVILAYTQSLKFTYITCVPLAGFSAVCAVFIKNRKVLGGRGASPKKAEKSEQQEDAEKQMEPTDATTPQKQTKVLPELNLAPEAQTVHSDSANADNSKTI